jgi:hypothetical protein
MCLASITALLGGKRHLAVCARSSPPGGSSEAQSEQKRTAMLTRQEQIPSAEILAQRAQLFVRLSIPSGREH